MQIDIPWVATKPHPAKHNHYIMTSLEAPTATATTPTAPNPEAGPAAEVSAAAAAAVVVA